MRNALSIDVEDYFQVHAFEKIISRATWERYPCRVEQNVRLILQILDENQVKATFFVLGWIAERYPHLVTEIALRGHEVATHGYAHELIYRQTPESFRADLQRALTVLRAALGNHPQTRDCEIKGYRAPSFSITRESLWALDILAEAGLRYDSSIFPLVAHDRYGIPNAARFPYRVQEQLWEVPVSTVRLAGRNWPIAGGGYFRLYPFAVTRWGIRRINAEGHPAIIYLHPWEFDPGQPHIRAARGLSRFRHYINLKYTEGRFRRLLKAFDFGPLEEVFGYD